MVKWKLLLNLTALSSIGNCLQADDLLFSLPLRISQDVAKCVNFFSFLKATQSLPERVHRLHCSLFSMQNHTLVLLKKQQRGTPEFWKLLSIQGASITGKSFADFLQMIFRAWLMPCVMQSALGLEGLKGSISSQTVHPLLIITSLFCLTT